MMMKQVLVLALLFCAAFAAPTEDLKAVEAAEAPEEQEVVVVEAAAQAPEHRAAAVPMSAGAGGRSCCPQGWFFLGSRCFLFVSSTMSWFGAENHCRSMEAQLASATSSSEYSFLQQLSRAGGVAAVWLGGFYLQGQWMWIDRQEMSYTNWYQQNSDFTSSSCIYLRTDYGWRNHPCTTNFNFICAKRSFTC